MLCSNSHGCFGCWGCAGICVSGPDFNGIERGAVVYFLPLGFAAWTALATQNYRGRLESRHGRKLESYSPSVSEFEPAFTLPRYLSILCWARRSDECCGVVLFWLEHEMHLHSSLLIVAPKESEVFCITQRTRAIDTLHQRMLCSSSCWSECADGCCSRDLTQGVPCNGPRLLSLG